MVNSMTRFCLLTFIVMLQDTQCQVITKLRSRVALKDTYETFSCSGIGSATLRIENATTKADIGFYTFANIPASLSEHQINITGSEETIDTQTMRTIDITIFTKASNNMTIFFCSFADVNIDKTNGTLYIAKDILGDVIKFRNPTLTFSADKKTMMIVWSAPWSHFVNSYTVNMNNKSSNEWSDYQLYGTEWTMSVENVYSDCHELVFFINALTDVGIVNSNTITTGFPINLSIVDDMNISVDLFQKQTGKFKTEISFESPNFCSNFQQILYNYSVYDHDHPYDFAHYGPLAQPILESEGFIENNGNYRVEISYWDTSAPSVILHVTKNFYTNFSLPPDTTTNTHNTTTSATCDTDKGVTDYTLVYIVASIGGVMIVMLIACIIVVIRLLFKLRAKRVPAISDVTEIDRNQFGAKLATTIKPIKRERKSSLPQIMATNPIYEGSSELYAYVPDGIATGMKENVPKPLRRQLTDVSLVIPPQLPPPRKMSLDSPGIKNGVQLSIDKHSFMQSESTDNDQYIPMRSTSELRYAKSPLMKSKLLESSEMKLKNDSKVINNNDNGQENEHYKE